MATPDGTRRDAARPRPARGLAPSALGAGVLWLGVTLGLLGIAGCTADEVSSLRQAGPRLAEPAPADFALVVTVSPRRTPAGNPGHLRAAQHVLEPDGTFRAALGPGTHANLLPPVTARLDPPAMDGLWSLTAPLMSAAPTLRRDSDVRVMVAVTAERVTRRLELPGAPAEPLLLRLAELRGDGAGTP